MAAATKTTDSDDDADFKDCQTSKNGPSIGKESVTKAKLPPWTVEPDEWFALADIVFDMYEGDTEKKKFAVSLEKIPPPSW